MIPRLDALQEVLAVTTMGAPAWVDWLILRRPLQRILRFAIVKPCAPRARVIWRALHSAEAVAEPRIAKTEARLAADIARLNRRLKCPD
jgi:NAD(P)H dehydrogenase (quinone)